MHFLPENRMCAPPFATKQRPPIWKILDPPMCRLYFLCNDHPSWCGKIFVKVDNILPIYLYFLASRSISLCPLFSISITLLLAFENVHMVFFPVLQKPDQYFLYFSSRSVKQIIPREIKLLVILLTITTVDEMIARKMLQNTLMVCDIFSVTCRCLPPVQCYHANVMNITLTCEGGYLV